VSDEDRRPFAADVARSAAGPHSGRRPSGREERDRRGAQARSAETIKIQSPYGLNMGTP
jgi:hypothetical protein